MSGDVVPFVVGFARSEGTVSPTEDDQLAHLFDDVYEFTCRYVGWTEEFRVGAVAWAIATWVYERFQHFPYLQFVGPHGFGKTTSTDVIRALCFKPQVFQGSTPAVIFRLASKGGTLLMDEVNGRPSGLALDVLRAGFSRNGCIPRCGSAEQGFPIQWFKVYGPKVLSGQHPLDDPALQSRMLTENLATVPQRDEPWPPYLPKSFAEGVGPLRTRLEAWAKAIEGFDYESVRLPDAMESRARQVFLPLYAICPVKHRAILDKLAERHKKHLAREVGDTPEAMVLQAVLDLGIGRSGQDETFYPRQVASKVNETREDSDGMSAKAVGLVLARLGFDKGDKDRGGIPRIARAGQVDTLALSFNLERR